MKQKRIALLAFLAILGCLSIDSAAATPSFPDTWSLTLTNPNWNRGMSVQATADGGYIVGICSNLPGRSENMVAVKLNSLGHTQWENVYGPGCPVAIQPLSAGGFAAAGWQTARVGLGITYVAVVVRIDSSGRAIWRRVSQLGFEPSGIAEGPQGSLYLYGKSTFASGSIFLAKLQASGEIIWQKQFGAHIGFDAAFRMFQDGTSLICFGREVHEYFAYKLSGNGDVIWSRRYTTSTPIASSLRKMQVTSDGGFAIAEYEPSISKFDNQGKLQWSRRYTSPIWRIVYSLAVDRHDNFLLAGVANTDVWLLNVDRAGNIRWQKTMGRSLFDMAWDATVAGDHFLVAGGQGNRPGHSDTWLLKIKASGELEGPCNFSVKDAAGTAETLQVKQSAANLQIKTGQLALEQTAISQLIWRGISTSGCGELRSVAPRQLHPGEILSVLGQGFLPKGEAPRLYFDRQAVTNTQTWSNNLIRFVLPASAVTGNVWIRNADHLSYPIEAVVLPPGNLQLWPDHGPAGTRVAFTPARVAPMRVQQVLFGNVSARNVDYRVCTAPAGNGQVNVTVTDGVTTETLGMFRYD